MVERALRLQAISNKPSIVMTQRCEAINSQSAGTG